MQANTRANTREKKFRAIGIDEDGERRMVIFGLLDQDEENIYGPSVNGVRDYLPKEGIKSVDDFTSLKDKNDADIYEGDILSPNNREVLFIENQYFDKGVGFYTICHNPEYPTVPFTFGRTQAVISKIIGNIHENPELIV